MINLYQSTYNHSPNGFLSVANLANFNDRESINGTLFSKQKYFFGKRGHLGPLYQIHINRHHRTPSNML